MKDFPIFPWDRDEKPYFVHGEYEWYVDKFVTEHARKDQYLSVGHTRKGLKDVVAFFVKKKNSENDVRSVLINDKQEVLFDESNSIALWNKVDIEKIRQDYMTYDDFEDERERINYITQIESIID